MIVLSWKDLCDGHRFQASSASYLVHVQTQTNLNVKLVLCNIYAFYTSAMDMLHFLDTVFICLVTECERFYQ